MGGLTETQRRVAEKWNASTRARRIPRTRWWEIPTVVRHINRRVAGEPTNGLSDGLRRLAEHRLAERSEPTPLGRGVSVGGGAGQKEMALLEAGLVERFDVFELSEARIEQGRELAHRRGLAERIAFHHADAFASVRSPLYDLVHWNNSLHHMMNIDAALKWSRGVLREGGLFFMDDFVGPSRFQWADRTLEVASQLRRSLDERYLRSPYQPGERVLLPTEIRRPRAVALIASDPSEAARSSLILPGVKAYFPNAEIVLTGGIVYNLVLSDALANFDESDPVDRGQLEMLLAIDETATLALGLESHYAVALAFKGPPPDRARVLTLKARGAAADALEPVRQRRATRILIPSRRARRLLARARRLVSRRGS